MAEPTPGPWAVMKPLHGYSVVRGGIPPHEWPEDYAVAHCGNEADALLIVRLVNAHAALPPSAPGEVRVTVEGPAGGDKHCALAALVLEHLRRTGAGLFVAGAGGATRFGDPALGGTPFTVVVRDRD